MRSLLAELKRRNVFRAALIYIAAVWALAQGFAQLAPVVGAADWMVRWFLVAAVIGFPLWVAFAWFYEWTPKGFRREREVERGESIARSTGRKLDFWIIGVLAVVVVLLITNQFVLRRDATSEAAKDDAAALDARLAALPVKSVAVLPFANESGDPQQAYFSDGLSEELITNLTQLADLKVIGKYSSFQFRDSTESPARIGVALGVANLIEGSVRQHGDLLRITIGMIRCRDGSSVWSQRFDRPLKDVFAIQDEIGRAVTAVLKVKLAGASLVNQQKPPDGNVEAYQLLLQGRARARRGTRDDTAASIALLQKAVHLAPDYAYAWAVLANVRINQGTRYLGGEERRQAFDEARSALDRATLLAPDAAYVYRNRGLYLDRVDDDPAGALQELQHALTLAPNDGSGMNFLATQLAYVGRPQEAADLLRKAIATDPLRADWYGILADTLIQLGRFDQAEQAARKAVALQPENPLRRVGLSGVLAARGRLQEAEQAAREAVALQPDDAENQLQLARLLDVRGHTDQALAILRAVQATQPEYPGTHAQLAVLDIRGNDPAAALRDAALESNPDRKAWALALAQQVAGDGAAAQAALQAYTDQYGATQALHVATLHAVRGEPDAMCAWLQRGVSRHDPVTAAGLLQNSLLLPWYGQACFVAVLQSLGLPAKVGGDGPPAAPAQPDELRLRTRRAMQ
ncbi:tetratricopeptide repeat protein [Dokdonella sp.]|uniref:tetratricopeptide repeat protein n=1 Tax=Dokdonella sp. TaxID=2291710 RepID=UPI0031C84A83|nr:tetratricopeptide repeat protein [Dokdonella sp.]